MALSFTHAARTALAFGCMSVAVGACPFHARAQCASLATTPQATLRCAASSVPNPGVATLDAEHRYSLAELIDLGEQNNPRTRIAWEAARQRAKSLGLEKSEYYPVLAGVALFADQRSINPFPKPLAPRGYTMVEAPVVEPSLSLRYLLLDFGGRRGRVDAARAEALAAGAHLIEANQQVAFAISRDFYTVLIAEERLDAARETLKTAQTTEEAVQTRLDNGRSTMPDLLNATAERAQAVFDLEAADGEVKISRVKLSEDVGVEPTPNLEIDAGQHVPLPSALSLSVDELIQRALGDRPDIAAQREEVEKAQAEVRVARSAYRPEFTLAAKGAQTSVWPTVDYGQLGSASEPTWSAEMSARWTIFDGGARKNRVAIAESAKRSAEDELRETRDQARREVWSSYIGFRTALRQEEAAVDLLKAADMSYAASLDAYNNGVKNLVDVVTAEKQLAQARFSSVSARSRLFIEAVQLESVTGNLLRHRSAATAATEEGPRP